MDEDSLEVKTALQAVQTASRLCHKIGNELAGGDALLKKDRSPVTIADYASQAIISRRIREKFPCDALVAEEDSSELRKPAQAKTLDQVTAYVREVIPGATPEEVCSWIDYSAAPNPALQRTVKGVLIVNPEQSRAFSSASLPPESRRVDFSSQTLPDRFWTLDPIDGTKGFLRGGQYAVALALVEKGCVQMGLLACPNLHCLGDSFREKKGCLFFALRGKG